MAEEQKPERGHPPAKPAAVMAVEPWEGEFPLRLKARFGDAVRECSRYLGQPFAVIAPEAVVTVLEYLKREEEFDMLVDLTAVDYPSRPERFDLVYILYSFPRNEHVRVKARIPDNYAPLSVTGVFTGANWLEREVFDMFGIPFLGHPELKRILLPEEWDGYPLRKEYGITQMDQHWVKENLGIESGQ